MSTMRCSFVILASCFLFACGGGGSGDDVGDDGGDDTVPGVCGDGTVNTGEECDDGGTAGGDGCDASCQYEPPTAARLTTMEVRDPHLFALDGSFDVTGTVNDSIADGINMDASDPPDGRLDLSFVLLFRPWDPAAGTGIMDAVAGANCTAPIGSTTCTPDAAATVVETVTTNGDATCLTPGGGTTGGYTPPVGTPSGRCFVTDKHVVSLTLGPVTLMLEDTQIAATYSTSAAGTLTSGLMTGFISQATADATILPADLPVVGGMPLSALLKDSDKDTGPGGDGWWFYLNFTASNVTYTE